MDGYTLETYGERIAEVYDQYYPEYDPAAIQVLAELAKGGKALELGIGTGRIALPLMQTGTSVQGIDISQSMVAKLRAKPGGESIKVTMGDFSDVNVDGKFNLIYVVFNTFFSLLTQEEQVRCFQNVTSHLEPGGVFVIEAFVPDLTRFTGGQAIRGTHVTENEARLDITMVEYDKQVLTSQHVIFTGEGIRFYPVKIRYVWPAEMDLMARLGHLQLIMRWSDWKKNLFTSGSRMHVSVYGHQENPE